LARDLRAVQERAFLTVPFSGSTLGVRIGALAYNLAEAMSALTRGTPLPSLQFSSVDLAATNGRQVVAKSGVKAYTKDEEKRDNVKIESWAKGLIVILSVGAVILVAFLLIVVQRERNGQPMFGPPMHVDGVVRRDADEKEQATTLFAPAKKNSTAIVDDNDITC
jgi:type IV secretory pathway TraG/TraD family ATPase VirD4